MAKTVETLTQNELEIIQEFMDAFGITAEEALASALAEGAISEQGESLRFAPEGFKELKYYVVNNKSHYYKINKALKKGNEMFEEDHFYYGTVIAKTDDGYDLEKCSTTDLGEKPRVIILANYFKAKRAAFDGNQKAELTNLETSLAPSLGNADQEKMLVLSGEDKGKSAKYLRDALKKVYPKDIPDKLKIKFRVITFGLVEVNGEWQRFYMETASRFKDEDKTTFHFDKAMEGIILKTKYFSHLEKTGEDDNDNAITQIIVDDKMTDAEFASLKDEINKARQDMLAYVSGQYNSAKADASTEKSKKADAEDDSDDSEDPFKD